MRLLATALILAACALTTSARAQMFAKIETVSDATFFMRSVRDAGMGCSGVADATTSASIAANPANAVGGDGSTVFFQHDEFLRDFSTSDFGACYGGGFGDGRWLWGIALRHQRWAYDSEVERTVFLPNGTGSTIDFDSKYTTTSLAAAWRSPWLLIALGAGARYESASIFGGDLSGWTYRTGARAEWYWTSPAGAQLAIRGGAAVMDLETGLDFAGAELQYKNVVRYGGGVTMSGGDHIAHPISRRPARAATVAVNLESYHMDFLPGDASWSLGMELGLAEALYLRGGTTTLMPGFSDGTTWGVGLATDAGPVRIRADVARYPLSNFFNPDSDNTIFGFSVSYSPPLASSQ